VSKEVSVQPEEVLKLIGSAPQRYDTVRAALRYRGDGSARKEISERIRSSAAGRRAFGISPDRPIYQWYPDGPFGWRSRAWHADDYHWRLEADRPDGGVNILASNGRTLSGGPGGGPQYEGVFWRHRVGGGSREDDPPWFDFANDHYWTFYALLTDEISGISGRLRPLDLTVEGTTVWAGREAVRLVGVPRERWDWEWEADPLSWGGDEYEVVVDAERGVLLRCASRLGSKDFDALEVEEIHFDERFPEDTFSSRQPLPWGR
jgi:hypothetical protein